MDNVQSPKSTLASTPLLSNTADQFHGIREKKVLVRKQKLYLKGRAVFVRRVFVRDVNAPDYRFVGWVVDEDCDFCFICAKEFSLFNRRHHCRVCGDLVCDDCSTGTVVLSEYYYYGYVRACDHCYYGQVGVTYNTTPPHCFTYFITQTGGMLSEYSTKSKSRHITISTFY